MEEMEQLRNKDNNSVHGVGEFILIKQCTVRTLRYYTTLLRDSSQNCDMSVRLLTIINALEHTSVTNIKHIKKSRFSLPSIPRPQI
jgi:hypothetical protein